MLDAFEEYFPRCLLQLWCARVLCASPFPHLHANLQGRGEAVCLVVSGPAEHCGIV